MGVLKVVRTITSNGRACTLRVSLGRSARGGASVSPAGPAAPPPAGLNPADPRRATNTPADIYPPAPAAAQRDRKRVGPQFQSQICVFIPGHCRQVGKVRFLQALNESKGFSGIDFESFGLTPQAVVLNETSVIAFVYCCLNKLNNINIPSTDWWNSFISQEWANVCLLSPLLYSSVSFSAISAWIQSKSQCLNPDLCVWM